MKHKPLDSIPYVLPTMKIEIIPQKMTKEDDKMIAANYPGLNKANRKIMFDKMIKIGQFVQGLKDFDACRQFTEMNLNELLAKTAMNLLKSQNHKANL